MEQDHLNAIIKENPNMDETAIARSQQAAKQLADAGIKLGGYRLMPALGDAIIHHGQTQARSTTDQS